MPFRPQDSEIIADAVSIENLVAQSVQAKTATLGDSKHDVGRPDQLLDSFLAAESKRLFGLGCEAINSRA